MRTANSAPERKKFENIQVLRFIAALMVLIMHAGIFTGDRLVEGLKPYNEGANGVTLFFVISGFVMIVSSQSLLKKTDGWRIFAVKRILRIVPIYWLLTTVKVVLLLVGTGAILHAKLDWIYILKSYLFIPATNFQNGIRPLLGVGWTLNYEMFFYFLFCLALFFRVRPVIFLALTIIPLFLGSFFRTASWSALPDFYFDPVLLNFLFGVVAGNLIMKERKMPRPLRIPAILVGLAVLFIPVKFSLLTDLEAGIVYGIMAFLVIYSGASIEITGQRRMPAGLVYMGAASYSLYLVHPMIGPAVPALLAKLGLQTSVGPSVPTAMLSAGYRVAILSATGVIAVSLLCGYLFYRFVETPITQMLERLRRNDQLSFRGIVIAVKNGFSRPEKNKTRPASAEYHLPVRVKTGQDEKHYTESEQ